jgi:hypothetical protein
MKKLSFLILFGLVAFTAGAQNNFMVYSFKGPVTVSDNKVESPAKVGKMLSNTSTLKIGAGGTATLICNEAAMFTMSKPGTYAMNKFGDSCKVTGGSVSSNYVKYVWAQLTTEHGTPGSNRKVYMSTVGAVSRGGLSNVWIDPKLDTINYSGTVADFPLSWKSYVDAKDFDFFLYSRDNLTDPLYKTTLNKLKIPISAFIGKLKPGTSYMWTAVIKGEDSEQLHVFNYTGKDAFEKLLNQLKSQGAAYEGAAEQDYRIAFLLEDHHYLAEALQYYTKAAAADSQNVLYRSTLMSFKKDYEIK